MHIGDSVGRLLTQQMPAMSMGDYNNQPGHAPALGTRPGVDTFDSESEQAKAKIDMGPIPIKTPGKIAQQASAGMNPPAQIHDGG